MAGRDIDGKGGAPQRRRQSPRTAFVSASTATAAVSARMIRGPSDMRNDERLAEKSLAFACREPALGPDQNGERARLYPAQRFDGIGVVFVLVAIDELSGRIPAGQGILQPDGLHVPPELEERRIARPPR